MRPISSGFAIVVGIVTVALSMTIRAQVPTRHESLPDNPCDLLTRSEVSAATRLAVIAVRRVPSISKIVQAQRENHEPGPGTICVFETTSEFGDITIALPVRIDRKANRYWEDRSRYFEAYPGSARAIPRLGQDAWLSAGADLHVLIRRGEYFTVATQMYHRQSGEVLTRLARTILDHVR